MKRKILIAIGCLFTVLACVLVARASFFDGGWRFNVGAAYNAPAKLNLHFSPVKFSGGNIVPSVPAGYTREEAKAIAEGKTEGTRTVYTDDGKVFYDTEGMTSKGTKNVKVPYSSWDAESKTFTLASAEYVEVEQTGSSHGSLKLRGEDEAAQPGIMVELSRNLYHNAEWHFGLDLAFAFSYFFDTGIYRHEHSSYESSSYLVTEGEYATKIRPTSGTRTGQPDADGNYGLGKATGIGPVFNSPVLTESSFSYYYPGGGSLYASGDYRDFEMMLALRPYYDILDWLRFYGTIGLAVSWTQFNLDVTSDIEGERDHHSRTYEQWDVYGIGGLGLMMRWNDFCLGFDFLARFLDNDLEFNDDIVSGSLRRGRWMFRGYVGYEF